MCQVYLSPESYPVSVAAGVGSATQSFQDAGLWIWWLLVNPLWPQSPSLAPLPLPGSWGERVWGNVWAAWEGHLSCLPILTPLARAHSAGRTHPQGTLGNVVSRCAQVIKALVFRERHGSVLRGWPLFSILFLLQETSWHHHKKGCSETYGPDGKPGPWIHHV